MINSTGNNSLSEYCKLIISKFDTITELRKLELERLGAYIANKAALNKETNLVVICTHNSRRSHIGQLWLQAAAQWYGFPSIQVYSGGTEATALSVNAIKALQNAGFNIEKVSNGENPHYNSIIRIKEPISIVLFSKTIDSPPNPKNGFAAIMVCSDADANCPFVPGADARFAVPFNDPKKSDGLENQQEVYDQSVQEIGIEFFYAAHHAFNLINQKSANPRIK